MARPVERALALAICVLLVAGLVGVVVLVAADLSLFDPDETSAQPAPGTQPTTTSTAAPRVAMPATSPPSTMPPTTTTEATVQAAIATTTSQPPTTTTTVLPGSVPPASGTYGYVLRYEDARENLEAKGQMAIGDARSVSGELRQTHVFNDEVYDTHSEAWAWRSDGIYLRSVGDSATSVSNMCDYEPDVLEYPLPLEVAKKWETKTRCKQDADSEPEESSSTIERTETVKIGGESVSTFVIKTFGFADSGPALALVSETIHFAPSVGVAVKGSTKYSHVSGGGGSSDDDWTESFELTSLTPN